MLDKALGRRLEWLLLNRGVKKNQGDATIMQSKLHPFYFICQEKDTGSISWLWPLTLLLVNHPAAEFERE